MMMKEISITLLAAKIALVFIAAASASTLEYELIHYTDGTTHLAGSIILQCRSGATAEELELNKISFFLNRSSAADPSLRERADIEVVEVGSTNIKFNLTRRLDGFYTCGRRVNFTHVIESQPKPLVCKLV